MKKWNNYLYHSDFTQHATALSAIAAGPLSEGDAQTLATILTEVDQGEGKEQWLTAEAGSPWHLGSAEVVHNGPNSRSLPTKSTYGKVLAVQLAEGRIYLQYN
jgi:hypothetical protein